VLTELGKRLRPEVQRLAAMHGPHVCAGASVIRNQNNRLREHLEQYSGIRSNGCSEIALVGSCVGSVDGILPLPFNGSADAPWFQFRLRLRFRFR
jgi:hypothetical protein